jgi:hypothetical protein
MSLADLEPKSGATSDPGNEVTRFHSFPREGLRREIRSQTPSGDAVELTFDLFAWWRANRLAFPILYGMACGYLIAPASSASVERQFSKAKLIDSDPRISLSEEKLEQLVFLREHLSELPVD